jgi:hypothetical protein
MKAQCEESGGRILLGDYTGCGRAVMLQTIRFQCTGVWIATGLPYTHTIIIIIIIIITITIITIIVIIYQCVVS